MPPSAHNEEKAVAASGGRVVKLAMLAERVWMALAWSWKGKGEEEGEGRGGGTEK